MAIKQIKIGATDYTIAQEIIEENSIYPVSSGAVFTALEEIRLEMPDIEIDYNHAIDGGNW